MWVRLKQMICRQMTWVRMKVRKFTKLVRDVKDQGKIIVMGMESVIQIELIPGLGLIWAFWPTFLTLRWSKRLTAGCPPNTYGCQQYLLVQERISDENGDPKNYSETVHSRFSKAWIEVMRSEIALMRNWGPGILWILQMGRMWSTQKYYSTLFYGEGKVLWHKARLLTRGFSQIPGIASLEVFSSIWGYATVRFMMALNVKCGWKLGKSTLKMHFWTHYYLIKYTLYRPRDSKMKDTNINCKGWPRHSMASAKHQENW